MRADRQRAGIAEAPPGTRLFVIDSNVWISAALSRGGAPARLVQRVLSSCRPVFTAATFAELESRLWKPKFDPYISVELRRRLLHDLSGAALWVEVPASLATQTFSRDADDDKFVHAALAANAMWLVSGDGDLLDMAPVPRLTVLSPLNALRQVFGVE